MHANEARGAASRQDILQDLRRVEKDRSTLNVRLQHLEEHLKKHPPETVAYQYGFEDLLALQTTQQDLAAQAAFLEELLHSPLSD